MLLPTTGLQRPVRKGRQTWVSAAIWAMLSLTLSWDVLPPEANVWGELEVASRGAIHELTARCFAG